MTLTVTHIKALGHCDTNHTSHGFSSSNTTGALVSTSSSDLKSLLATSSAMALSTAANFSSNWTSATLSSISTFVSLAPGRPHPVALVVLQYLFIAITASALLSHIDTN